MKKLRIVFMGTPDFAVGILKTVLENEYDVVGVITAADKPAGRGQQVRFSAVKEFALEKGLNLMQPTNLKDEDFIADLKALHANLQIVVAFRMLPEVVWKMPELGTFNLHASLLPDYRGAAPINWAIINGEQKTGVTTFFIDEKIDTGAIILQSETEISENEKAGELHDRLMHLGSDLVIKTLKVIENENVASTIQNTIAEVKTAHKLNKENCKIDWSLSAKEIHDQVRGLSPYPVAWTNVSDGEKEFTAKIYETEKTFEDHHYEIGQVLTSKNEMKVAVKDGFIMIRSLQLAGKKRLTASELLNGQSFSEQAKVC